MAVYRWRTIAEFSENGTTLSLSPHTQITGILASAKGFSRSIGLPENEFI